MPKNENNWSIYIGIVMEDKEPHSRIAKIYAQELLPFVEGDLIASSASKEIVINNGTGSYSTKVTTTNYIEAIYFGLETNRAHPPDIYKGEQVLLFKYADSDKYYWYSMGRDDKVRRLERFRLQVSDKRDNNPDEDLNDTNTYYLELDTLHNKHILIRTNKRDSEKYTYQIKIDANKHTVIICDDANNEILLESDIPRIRLRNNKGTIVDLNNEDIHMVAPQDVAIKAGRQLVLGSPLFIVENSTGTTHIKSKSLMIDAIADLILKAPTIPIDGTVIVPKNILATLVQAGGFSCGVPASYSPITTDIESGSGSSPSNPPQPGSSSDTQRHAAAQEEVLQAFTIVKNCIDALAMAIASVPGGTMVSCQSEEIVVLAEESLMPKNQGE